MGHFTDFAVLPLSHRPLTVRTLIHPRILLRPPVNLSTGRATKWHFYPRPQRLEHGISRVPRAVLAQKGQPKEPPRTYMQSYALGGLKARST